MLDNAIWAGLFLGSPAIVLVIALVHLTGSTQRQWNAGHWRRLTSILAITAIAAGLLIRFATEKLLLVTTLLCWAYLMFWAIRRVLGPRPTTHVPAEPLMDGPHALNFSGVDRGFQGFGIYEHGVRVGNDSIDDDAR